jgi:uridylate kinase
VDGIYTADPMKNPQATKYKTLTYHEALTKQLKVMDAAAFSLCQENHIPILVFNFFKENEILRAVQGKPVGTLVSE